MVSTDVNIHVHFYRQTEGFSSLKIIIGYGAHARDTHTRAQFSVDENMLDIEHCSCPRSHWQEALVCL